MIKAEVIRDSIFEGDRLTTVEVEMPRFVLAEFNTHRAFSRNSASSRAIPITKQIERVANDPFVPAWFYHNQKGMSAGEPLSKANNNRAKYLWLQARTAAVEVALQLQAEGLDVHKQWVNRILEPYMWHKAIVTSHEWDNFFRQRCHPAAQPEMKFVADDIHHAIVSSEPTELPPGGWHLPYVTEEDAVDAKDRGILISHVSIARCARVSYLTHDKKRDIEEDKKLYDKLVESFPPHASPLEHVAYGSSEGIGDRNFGRKWVQHRQLLGL